MNITVVGAGYVGLTTAVGLASHGHHVVCMDRDVEKVNKLCDGQLPFLEPGLGQLFADNRERLEFTTSMAFGVTHAEVIFIAVPTPGKPNGTVDTSKVEDVARAIGRELLPGRGFKLIVVKSTVPELTCAKVHCSVGAHAPAGADYEVAYNPEFLREGTAVNDFLFPERIVIGTRSERAKDKLYEIYKYFRTDFIATDVPTAELIKQASNAFLAMKISFINTMADVCEAVGGDVMDLAWGMGMDSRINRHFLNAGLGYGGSCFSKDVRGLIHTAETAGVPFNMLRATEEVNNMRVPRFVGRIDEVLKPLKSRRIMVWGLAFKGGTEDIRGSQGVQLVRYLLKAGAQVAAFDPLVSPDTYVADGLVRVDDMYAGLAGEDALVITTDSKQWADADLDELAAIHPGLKVFDGRNILDLSDTAAAGLEYYSVGR